MNIIFFILMILITQSDAIINPPCIVCHDLISILSKSMPKVLPQFIVDSIAIAYCTQKHLECHKVCKGAVKQMVKVILPSLWKHYTDPHLICQDLKICSKEYINRNISDDISKILSGKIDKHWQMPSLRKKLKIMHISDIHVDLFYTQGAPSKCSQPVCCRTNVTKQMDPWKILLDNQAGITLKDKQINDNPAGYWGSLNDCDLPLQTFNLFLKELSKIDVDLIIWTGDNTPHDIWQQSQSYNLNFTTLISQKIRKYTKAVVIATMGNHESYPVNVYDYAGERQTMLNAGLAQAWRPWLTDKAHQMLRTKGYFSIELPQFNNLKILSVNTQAQNNQNWFLLRDPTDPGGMLQWIQDQLKQSQIQNQIVYIIGHIPPRSALNDWGMRFNALTDRYSYTLRGQFYGHTHTDHVGLFFSFKNKSELVSYCLIAPSLQCGKHPEYRIMDIDFDTLQVLDYDQYVLNLTKYTKKQDDARFELFYSFKKAYGLTDMLIDKGMTSFNMKMQKDEQIQKLYSYFRKSGLQQVKSGRQIYCDTMTSQQFTAQCLGKSYTKSWFQKISGNWKDLKHHSQ